MNEKPKPGFETLCVHHAEQRRLHLGAAAPPLYQNSTFTFPDSESITRSLALESSDYIYTRVANPTTDILEKKMAELEQGEAARTFASGMAAISCSILSCVRPGDHIITIETVYGPTRRFFSNYLTQFNIETTYVRGTNVDEFRAAIRPNTRLIYVESPSSLLFDLQDLAAVAELAKSKGIATICDNSNATPLYQNPISLGIDMVAHTATKYIGGHSDLVAGIVVGPKERMASIAREEGELLGGIVDPFAAWLMLRGLRTLSVRLERHQRSARRIAQFLESDARVARVYYPGLDSHPQALLAREQMRGQSGMLSFALTKPDRETAHKFVDSLEYFCIAVSWGGYESLAIPLEVTDLDTGRKQWIVRLSVGLESLQDLLADVYQALGLCMGG